MVRFLPDLIVQLIGKMPYVIRSHECLACWWTATHAKRLASLGLKGAHKLFRACPVACGHCHFGRDEMRSVVVRIQQPWHARMLLEFCARNECQQGYQRSDMYKVRAAC